MNVLLLSRYGRQGASSRVRFYQYLPYLEEHGVRVTIRALFSDRYLKGLYGRGTRSLREISRSYLRRLADLATVHQHDLVWVEGEAFPWLPPSIETAVFGRGVPTVVDYDDAIFHRYDLHRTRAVRWALGGRIDRVMRAATAVTAGNEYLARRASRAGASRVEIFPSVVDLAKYPEPEGSAPRDELTVGWIGTPATEHYLELVYPALRQLAASGPLRLRVVGAEAPSGFGFRVESRPWSEEAEAREIATFDVGIMPLAEGPWELGKCGYKLIQCMAAGVPVVASAVGANRAITVEGETGFLASTTDDWLRALATLRADPVLRSRMGAAGRERVARNYSLAVMAPRVLSLLEEVAGSSGVTPIAVRIGGGSGVRAGYAPAT